MNFPLFIARKIYNDKGDKHQVSRPAIRIATIGVAIGLAVMIISVSVVLGFKHTIRDKVIGFGSHITVAHFLALQQESSYPICIDDSLMNVLKGINDVKHVQRYAMKQGILKTDEDFMGVMFKGVSEEFDTTFIHENMVEGVIPKFSSKASSNKILISKMTADKLKLKLGDKVFTYFIDNNDVRARKFNIVGIYQTNLTRFDKIICFCDLYTSVKLNGWEEDQVSGAELTVKDYEQLDKVEDDVVKYINRTLDKYGETISSSTVEQMNPQIFTWLDLLDLNVWIILALMICVAGITMISGLLKKQNNKTHFPLVRRLHHWQRYAMGQHRGHRTHCTSALHGNSIARPRHLLCQHSTRGVQFSHHSGNKHCHPYRKRACADSTKLPHLVHPSCQVDEVRIKTFNFSVLFFVFIVLSTD